MCTRTLWSTGEDLVLAGRTMDYEVDLRTNLWAFPRGLSRDNGVDDSLRWTSVHGSVVAAAYDLASTDGINEAGLADITVLNAFESAPGIGYQRGVAASLLRTAGRIGSATPQDQNVTARQ